MPEHDNTITIEMTEEQLKTIISGLLFSCSVNVVSNVNEEYQRQLFELAKALKTVSPDVKLNEIQFVEEENYEDVLSEELLEEFKNNIEVVSFNEV
jgi:hypothetical protein